MAKKKRRRGLSLGTVFMLAFTLAVLLLSALFLFAIVGEDLYEKTGAFIRSLSEQGLFEPDEPDVTPEPKPTSVWSFLDEETPVPHTPLPTLTPVPGKSTVTIAAAGTVYAPKAVYQSALEGGRYDFEPVFVGLGNTLMDADLALATLETSTASDRRGYGNYNAPPEILDGLRSCGVDLVSLSTERALDMGYDGLDLTLSEMTTRGLISAGVYPDEKGANAAAVMSVNGVQIAVLAYTYGLSEEGKEKTKDDSRGVLARLDVAQMEADIRQARVNGAHIVIVMPHWGTKNKSETPQTIRSMARSLAEAGADVILGTHPNVAQETERLRVTRADGLAYDAVVCYSLGSLLTDSRTEENTASMIAHLSVTFDPVTRRIELGELYCTPVYIARQRLGDGTVYRIVDPENAQAVEALDARSRDEAERAVERIRETVRMEEGQG